MPSGVATVVLGPFNLLRYGRKGFAVTNWGTVTLSGCVVQINPDNHGIEPNAAWFQPGPRPEPTTAWWQTLDQTTFANLAAGESRVVSATNDQSQAITASGFVFAQSA